LKATQQSVQGHFGFDTGQWRTKTEMDAMTKGEVTVFHAVQVEPVRLNELAGIVIGRSQGNDYPLSGLN